MTEFTVPQAELSAVTPPSVVRGLGFPNGRAEVSVEPTGWLQSSIGSDGAPLSDFSVLSINGNGQAK
jgi:hypothetical protein